ncbi:hypothetical protein [Candidatus Villigracilis affinis]|uniref:hypothetical protein n=1 Tax=Candidatus Villigracilis affinis TaxID=3140682 RepID=UPI001DE2C7D8|nr:hypothetical protein [Anaerolineales bacterium]
MRKTQASISALMPLPLLAISLQVVNNRVQNRQYNSADEGSTEHSLANGSDLDERPWAWTGVIFRCWYWSVPLNGGRLFYARLIIENSTLRRRCAVTGQPDETYCVGVEADDWQGDGADELD